MTAFSGTMLLFLFIISGFLLRRFHVVSDTFGKNISSMLVSLLLPALIMDIIIQKLTLESLLKEYPSFLLSVLTIAITYVIFKFFSRFFHQKSPVRAVFIFSMVFANFGFMGQPIIEALYGDGAMLIWALYVIPYYAVVNILGPYILDPESDRGSLSLIINPTTIGIALGTVMGLCEIKPPEILSNFLSMAGSTVVPLSMILIGFVLGGQSLRKMFNGVHIYIICILRLLILPLLTLGLLYLFGFREYHLYVPVIITAMPVAANGVMVTEDLGGDSLFMAKSVFLTTVLSLATIPLIAVIVAMVH